VADGDACIAPARVTPTRVQMGDIVRAYGDALRATSALRSEQHEVLAALARCRTAALGGHLAVCAGCGHKTPVYNSCRNRHCPTCQNLDEHRWLEARHARILPTRYVHVVFTLPEVLRPIVRANARVLYAMLFEAASQTLLTLAKDPRRLGALPSITMVLHTWTRELLFHPHLHAVVSAGGLSPDGARWITKKGAYLFPVKVMAKLFRGKFRALLLAALTKGTVTLPEACGPNVLNDLRRALLATRWVVYAKAPFGGAAQVYAYLGRYTHRVGISNARLRTVDARGVTFATKKGREIALPGEEFLRRFMEHVLPKGFTRIRHYGLLAASHATTTLERARVLLTPTPTVAPTAVIPTATPAPSSWQERLQRISGHDATRCAHCGMGHVMRVPLVGGVPVAGWDTS
jgi:hypothetical protein